MGSRGLTFVTLGAATFGSALVVACAVGSNEEPTVGEADAASLEASLPGVPDAGVPTPEKDAAPPDSGPKVSAACAAALGKATFDFEGSDQGFTHVASDNAAGQATWPFDPWSRGSATTIACPDGMCWGSERNQNYAQCHRGELVSPRIDLSACAGEKVSLAFSHAYAFWTGVFSSVTYFDGGIVEVSGDDGGAWTVPTGTYPGTVKILGQRSGFNCVLPNAFHVDGKSGFVGSQATPTTTELELPSSVLTANLRIRFSQGAGVSTAVSGHAREGTAAGWRIDDVKLVVK